uniref:hypothetical protein n=1 Tax=Pedobacter schmidteae TaxID=2201271 RepID=UPI0013CE763C|nr:hypothetical protein [Pedobacter schmidteae]
MRKLLLYLTLVFAVSLNTTQARGLQGCMVTIFVFNGSPGQEYDPTQYQQVSTAPNCPSYGKLCAILVPGRFIYTSIEVYTLGLPPTYIGRPKVDALPLMNKINLALATFGEVTTPDSDCVTILEKF